MNRPLLGLAPLLLVASCAPPAPEIEVRDAWARATAPGQSNGAIYATIINTGGADQLTGAATASAEMAIIHATETVDGVSRMRMTGDLAIPAGATVALMPGGTHIMLDGLKTPLVAGEPLSLDLRFAKTGTRSVAVSVVAPGSR